MTEPSQNGQSWKTLDKDLNRIAHVEYATAYVARPLVAPGIALAFIVVAGLVAAVFFGTTPVNTISWATPFASNSTTCGVPISTGWSIRAS